MGKAAFDVKIKGEEIHVRECKKCIRWCGVVKVWV